MTMIEYVKLCKEMENTKMQDKILEIIEENEIDPVESIEHLNNVIEILNTKIQQAKIEQLVKDIILLNDANKIILKQVNDITLEGDFYAPFKIVNLTINDDNALQINFHRGVLTLDGDQLENIAAGKVKEDLYQEYAANLPVSDLIEILKRKAKGAYGDVMDATYKLLDVLESDDD